MLPATLQFLITIIACAINERIQRKLDYGVETLAQLAAAMGCVFIDGRRCTRRDADARRSDIGAHRRKHGGNAADPLLHAPGLCDLHIFGISSLEQTRGSC
jgi:hypothetical protein